MEKLKNLKSCWESRRREMSKKIGMDVGTNMLIAGISENDKNPIFKNQRDCFYKIKPKTEVNKTSIKMSLDKRGVSYIIDEDGCFVIVGQDSLDIAIERNDVAKRPMMKGIISPKDKASLPMLKFIIKELIGEGQKDDKCVYSVPAKPIDGNFDTVYHREILGTYIRQMGYTATHINEAFAIALSELLDDGLNGICISYGAGMTNVAITYLGDLLVEFSILRAGDFIDMSVANALDVSPSLVQMEKEAGTDLYKPSTKIMEAISVYYSSVINYTIQNISYELKKREKSLPQFKDPVTVVVAGGLSLAKGFVRRVEESINIVDLPMRIGNVRRAEDPLKAVAQGALIAALM
jgi:actin-like ATPase involved in cell morphogenesis